MAIESVGTPSLWVGFTVVVFALLALDLGVFHRKSHVVGIRESLIWTCVWIALSMVFAGFVYAQFGAVRALEYVTGFVIEKALSVDNLFVFLVVFAYFGVPREHQHRVLFWGIIGALVMRAVFIVLGAALLQSFHWIMYVFGAFLVYTGVKLFFSGGDEEMDPSKNPALRLFRRFVPTTDGYRGGRFVVVEGGKRLATPLLMVLFVVEATDVMFAVDSIPAIFAITQDPFIVYTSNIFAILGLRALFFALAGVMNKFHYLKVGLSIVLAFVGMKMLIVDFYKVPIAASLGVVAFVLTASVVASLLRPLPEEAPASDEGDAAHSPEALTEARSSSGES